MKKFCAMVLLLTVIILTFTACKSNETEQQAEAKEAAAEQSTEEQTAEGITGEINEEEIIQEDYVLKTGTIDAVVYDSEAIANNLIEERTEQNLYVYLPPTYYESDKKYPVVYFLHGFNDSAAAYIRNVQTELDEAFSQNPSRELIIVAVDGANARGGSFYVNSPVAGNWEDYTCKEVVSYVDTNYRTIANVRSRGIYGFSMGGFGALNLAFLHPDIYGAVYAISPGVLAPGKIGDALDTWNGDRGFLKAYSMAFAYNTTPPYESIPLRDGSQTDNALLERWESGFGNWREKLDAYLALDTPLTAIGLNYGTSDGYRWIPEGIKYLSGLLEEEGVEHILYTFEGGHVIPKNELSDHLLPFFREALVWE